MNYECERFNLMSDLTDEQFKSDLRLVIVSTLKSSEGTMTKFKMLSKLQKEPDLNMYDFSRIPNG